MLYTAFVIDTFADKIVGWKVSSSAKAGFVLDAVEQAIHARSPDQKLIHHSDRGKQYLFIKYTNRLAEIGADPSVGRVGHSYDNALAETIIGLYKTELVHSTGTAQPLGSRRLNSNGKLSCGSIGSTTADCSLPSATSHHQKRRKNTMKI